MDLRQLRHFVAVVRHGNMLRASEALHVTQPALSKSIKSLEASVGVTLLKRSPRGVDPTPYGRQLYDHAKLILNKTRQAEEELQAAVDGQKGHVAIGFGAAIAGSLLPQSVLSVIAAQPGVTASILSKPFDEILVLLREGELDFAFVVFPPEPQQPGLVYEPLIVDVFQTLCRPAHPYHDGTRLSLERLTAADWVLFDRPSIMQARFSSLFVDADLPAPQPTLTTTSVFILKWTVREADFLTYAPTGLFLDDLDAGRLVALPTELEPVRIKAGIVYREDDILPAAANAVVRDLRRRRTEAIEALVGHAGAAAAGQ